MWFSCMQGQPCAEGEDKENVPDWMVNFSLKASQSVAGPVCPPRKSASIRTPDKKSKPKVAYLSPKEQGPCTQVLKDVCPIVCLLNNLDTDRLC